MHIAVVVPAFNAAPWLGDCLGSLLNQTHADWHAVVIDDGSVDATAEIGESFGDPRIQVVRQGNGGVSAARNRGIASLLCWRPRPDAVLFLDADDWLAGDAMAQLSGLLEDSPWAVAAAGCCVRVAVDGQTRRFGRPPQGQLLRRLLMRNLFVNGGHVLVRREAVEEAGPFRLDMTYGEDWEYWTRLALLGEFVALRSRRPILFVRERPNSAYWTMATDPARGGSALATIFANPAITNWLGQRAISDLRRRAEAEAAWAVGRELIRHGMLREGRAWLRRSIRQAPNFKRFGLVGLSWLRSGPFRPYGGSA